MDASKVMCMRDAVSRYIKAGSQVFLSGAQHGEPVAAIHEIARQGIGGLHVVSTLTHTISLLIGNGLVSQFSTAYLMHTETINKTRELGKYPILHEYSHHSLSLALLAGKMGVSFVPARVTLGSDVKKHNAGIGDVACPFTGDRYAAIRAINPDVCVIHVQRADREGNAQKWGSLGLDVEGVGASRDIIVTTEALVDSDVIRREPNLTIVPGYRVKAVVHQPYGAFPMHLSGCYNGDIVTFEGHVRKWDAFREYTRAYIRETASWEEYMEKMAEQYGEGYFRRTGIREPLFSDPVRTGY